MDVIAVVQEVLCITNAVIGESSLPDFFCAADDRPKGVGVSAFDELNGVFDGDVVGGCQQQMNVLGHDDEGVELESAFAAVAVDCFQKKAGVILDHEESSTLPSLESNEVRSGRREES